MERECLFIALDHLLQQAIYSTLSTRDGVSIQEDDFHFDHTRPPMRSLMFSRECRFCTGSNYDDGPDVDNTNGTDNRVIARCRMNMMMNRQQRDDDSGSLHRRETF